MDGDPTTSEWLTLKQAAKRVKLAYKTVWRAANDGTLPSSQRVEGGAIRVKTEDLEEWLKGSPCTQPAPRRIRGGHARGAE